jgi:nucleoside-diphosphate-sugar epimerase
MRVCVTGASGFLGSWVCRVLVKEHDVVALLRTSSSEYRLRGISNLSILRANFEEWPNIINKLNVDALLCLHWDGVGNKSRNSQAQLQNVIQYEAFLTQLKYIPIVVGTGSQAELGPVNGPIWDSTPDGPTTIYGQAKVETRQIFEKLGAEASQRVIWARIFSTYGPLDSPDWLIPQMIDSLLSGRPLHLTQGQQIWSYTHGFDVGQAFSHLLSNPQLKGTINVSDPATITIRSLGEMIVDRVGLQNTLVWGKLEYRHDQVMKLEPKSESLIESGWAPEVELVQGIDHLVSWLSGAEVKNLETKNGSKSFELPPLER